MRFKLIHFKSEAFKVDCLSKQTYERLRIIVVYKDGSVIDNLQFWFDYAAMKGFALRLAQNSSVGFTIYFIELRHTATPHCSLGNLLMTSKCRFYEK